MKILVTGSSGFIGQHTVKILIEDGHEIFGLDRNYIHHHKWCAFCDITNPDEVNDAFEVFKPDAVLHLAANSSLQKGIEDPVYDAQNNIIGTINVLQAAKEHGCKRIVFASTSAVYDPFIRIPYREDDPPRPFTPYGVSKLACENYIKISGLDYLILRYGNVYGPGQKPLGENILIARAIAHMINGEPFMINGDGEQIRDWIFVDDVARANLRALKYVGALKSWTMNISTGRGHSVNIVMEILKNIIGFKDEIKHGPAIGGEINEVVMNNNDAIVQLGWDHRVKLIDGLERTVKAWKKEPHGLSAGV